MSDILDALGELPGTAQTPGKELARTHRSVDVIPEGAWTGTTLTVILPPPMTPAEWAAAFVSLPKYDWRRWVDLVADATREGDVDTVQTLLDLGLRKGFA